MEKILIVDDFEPVRKVIKRIVERENYAALVAQDGEEGLEIFERERPEIVITDLKMPKIDGKGVLTAVKQISPETQVIVLTGYGENETAKTLMQNGAFAFLKKPLDLQQLVSVLDAANANLKRAHKKNEGTAFLNKTDVCIKLNEDKRIQIDWIGDENEAARTFAKSGADQFPCPLIVLGARLQVYYTNDALNNIVPEKFSFLNEKTVEQARARGLRLPSGATLIKNLSRIIEGKNAEVSAQETSDYNAMFILKAYLMKPNEMEEPILILFFTTK